MKSQTIAIFAMVCITFIETLALLAGINGQLLRWTMILIAGLGGLAIPQPEKLREYILKAMKGGVKNGRKNNKSKNRK